MADIVYGQDGESVSDADIKILGLEKGDTKYNKNEKREVFDFVGFVLSEKAMLSVFPKYYFKESDINLFNDMGMVKEDDIRLLFEVIFKYISTEKTKAKASKYMGESIEYVSDYPFAPFFAVYNYYRKYGIYQENLTKAKAGSYGKISWKDTIQKSQTLICDGNLIFSPLYMKKRDKKHVFLSDCMAFVINHTLELFPYFLSIPRINYSKTRFGYLDNIDFVLRELHALKVHLFKDIHKELVDNIILFFEQYSKSSRGGDIHIKINYFNKIWERMVGKYLNDFFVGVDDVNDKLLFDKTLKKSLTSFSSKKYCIDDSPHRYEIILDHYANQGGFQYIFDSKYYYNVSELNYKQFSYNELMRPLVGPGSKTYSALILPGNTTTSSLHLSLNPTFIGERTTCTKIIELYLDIREVMLNYVGWI